MRDGQNAHTGPSARATSGQANGPIAGRKRLGQRQLYDFAGSWFVIGGDCAGHGLCWGGALRKNTLIPPSKGGDHDLGQNLHWKRWIRPVGGSGSVSHLVVLDVVAAVALPCGLRSSFVHAGGGKGKVSEVLVLTSERT